MRTKEQRAQQATKARERRERQRQAGIHHTRTPEERERENAQARAKRARRRIAKLALIPPADCHEGLWPRFGTEPTARERLIVAEVCEHGGLREATICLGVSYQNGKARLSGLYRRLGVTTFIQAVMLLGWVNVPRRFRRVHRVR